MPDAAKMNTRLSYLVVKETDDGKPAKGRRINYVRMWSIAGSIKWLGSPILMITEPNSTSNDEAEV